MNPIELGKFLAKLRNEKKLTQDDLANMLYIDKRKISRWECGNCTPDFDMLIKLSEILDVSLYELSICRILDKEKLSDKVLNKFKSIKDLKKYKLKNILKTFLLCFLFLLLIITTVFTIRNYKTIQIYSLESLDKNYSIEGNIIRIKDNVLFNIRGINTDSNNAKMISNNECEYTLYNNKNKRVFHHYNEIDLSGTISNHFPYKVVENYLTDNGVMTFEIICDNNKKSFNIEINKIYENRIFDFNNNINDISK